MERELSERPPHRLHGGLSSPLPLPGARQHGGQLPVNPDLSQGGSQHHSSSLILSRNPSCHMKTTVRTGTQHRVITETLASAGRVTGVC